MPENKLQITFVLLGYGGGAYPYSRQIDALTRFQHPVCSDCAADLAAPAFQHLQTDQAVIDQHCVSGVHIVSQLFIDCGYPLPGSHNIVGGNNQLFTGCQLYVRFQIAQPDLRTAEIREHSHRNPGGLTRSLDVLEGPGMRLMIPMGEVEPDDIQPGFQQPFKYLYIRRSRSDGSNNLRSGKINTPFHTHKV